MALDTFLCSLTGLENTSNTTTADEINLSFAQRLNKKYGIVSEPAYKLPHYPIGESCDSMDARVPGERQSEEQCTAARAPDRGPEAPCCFIKVSSKTWTDDNGVPSLSKDIDIDTIRLKVENDRQVGNPSRSYDYDMAVELLKNLPGNLTSSEFQRYRESIRAFHASDIEMCHKKCMVFKKKGYNSFVIGPYNTRFTDRKYRKDSLEKLESIFTIAKDEYTSGVFFTLTCKPDSSRSLYDINRDAMTLAQKVLNKYIKRAERKGIKTDYVLVPEFQGNGRIHFHAVIFGLSRLDHYTVFREYIQEIGFGFLNDLQKIVYSNGCWHKPKEVKDVSWYLSKYLKKSIRDPTAASLYWAHNRKFFTNSALFNRRPEGPLLKTLFKDYTYLGTFLKSTVRQMAFDKILLPLNYKSYLDGWNIKPPDADYIPPIDIRITNRDEELIKQFPEATYDIPEFFHPLPDGFVLFHINEKYYKLPIEALKALFKAIQEQKEVRDFLGVNL